MGRSRYLVLAFLLFSLRVFPAAETVTLSLDEAVIRALDQSINLKKSAIDLAQAEYSASHLWSEIFPGFSLSAGLNFLPSTPLLTDPGFNYNNQALTYSLNFRISLSLNPSLSSTMKRIELAYRGQLLSYENASKQLEIQVIKSFLNLVSRKETIAFMEESLDVAEKILERDRVAREHGMLSELQWLNSRLSAERARYNLSDAITTYQNELGPFLTTLGMDVGMDINFTGNVEIVPVNYNPEELILEYLPKRPDIIAQRQTIERLELTKKISTSNNPRLPSLSLDTQWRGGSPNNNSKGFDAPFTDSLSGSLTVNIPIDSWIPGTRQNQSLRSADAEVEKAKLDLQNTETNAKNNIRLLVSNLNNTWESLQIAQLRMEIAQHTVDATEKGFINGIVEFRELENVRKDLTDYRQQLIRQEYAYQSLLLDLAAALNVDWRTLTNEIPSFEALNQRSIR